MEGVAMRGRSVFSSALTLSLFLLSVPAAHAASGDCQNSCAASYSECSRSCGGMCDQLCLDDYSYCMQQCQSVDSDGDGVADSSDNCPDVANANQADCDGDHIGNVCDSMNGNFVASSLKGVCASDRDDHVWGFTIEVTYQQQYFDTSSCHSPARNDQIVYTSSCSFNYNEYTCCQGATLNDLDDHICSPVGQYACSPDTMP
jgi:hypothetical protein